MDHRLDDVMWIAQRHGQDWRDVEVLGALDWLTSLVPRREWEQRIAAESRRFEAARYGARRPRDLASHDPHDAIAWYLIQARCYADPRLRADFFEPSGYRIAPLFRRIGQLLPDLRAVRGVEERAARLMTSTSQPDDVIYEMLVGATYRRRGWERVEFVAETPGTGKQPDLLVERPGSRWAVECKRAGRSTYVQDERKAAQRMADRVHAIALAARRPVLVMAGFADEPVKLPEDYLADKVRRFADGGAPNLEWADEGGSGGITTANLDGLQRVLRHDDVYFGSSRMAELLIGRRFEPVMDFSVDGDWTPAEGRPLHATWVDHASIVVWVSRSEVAELRKAQHFRGVVGRASEQLPSDCPGVIHVGYEATGGNFAEGLRHGRNEEQMRTFDARTSAVRWVYANYFMPEHVTARNESCAVVETMAWHAVGTPDLDHPLPNHMLFLDEDGHPGTHFHR